MTFPRVGVSAQGVGATPGGGLGTGCPGSPRAGGPLTSREPEWPALLAELTRQMDTGAVYARDVPAITVEFDASLAAITRRGRPWAWFQDAR